jgi:hypothetical protein
MAMKYRRELTVEESDALIKDLDAQISVLLGPDHEQRLKALEAARANGQQDAPSVQFIVESELGELPGTSIMMPSELAMMPKTEPAPEPAPAPVRKADYEGKSAAEISAMVREEFRLEAKARADAAVLADERRRGKSAILGR